MLTPENPPKPKRSLPQAQSRLQGPAAAKRRPAWQGFAHPGHQPEDLHRILKSLRNTLTHLLTLESENRAIPFFRQGLGSATFRDLQSASEWLLENSEWKKELPHPELIPLLANPETRRMIQEFARDCACAKKLQSILEDKLEYGSEPSLAEFEILLQRLKKAREASERLEITDQSPRELADRITQLTSKLERIDRSIVFFEAMRDALGVPSIQTFSQARKFFAALEIIERIPQNIHPWRVPHVLDGAQRLKLQTWKIRARPILELRKSLNSHFHLETEIEPSALDLIAQALKVEGWLAHFQAPYREALRNYRSLLKDETARKVDAGESDYQRSERLEEWKNYLEQSQSFRESEEAQSAFSPHFFGIDTDFNAALEAGSWAQKMSEEIFKNVVIPCPADEAEFDLELIEFVKRIPAEKAPFSSEILKSPDAREASELIRELIAEGFHGLKQAQSLTRSSLKGYQEVMELSGLIGFGKNLPFANLKSILESMEEFIFLYRRVNSNQEFRAQLGSFYQGIHTDLFPLENAARYVRHIATACCPDSLSENLFSTLFSSRGPFLLAESKPQIERILLILKSLKKEIDHLEAVTHGQIHELHGSEGSIEGSLPLIQLMESIQDALRQPQSFLPQVIQLKERESRRGGDPTGLTTESPKDCQSDCSDRL